MEALFKIKASEFNETLFEKIKSLIVVYMNAMKTILLPTKQSGATDILISTFSTNTYLTKRMNVIVIVQMMKIHLVYQHGLTKVRKLLMIVA